MFDDGIGSNLITGDLKNRLDCVEANRFNIPLLKSV